MQYFSVSYQVLAYWWTEVVVYRILLLPDVALGVNNMPSDGTGQKHTGVVLIALVAELKMGCAHIFSPLEDTGETQRLLEAWKNVLFCFL